ncbi:hypothetical protein PCC9214_05426 (plasmid) [Planktothrix tepida]|uniref:CRISPR type III-B/RAMP module-associated protein Cmr5 n=1 Tax=Planktothrix tepida PCC 9214 TaxID=671072 RepID=A0A1J1LVA5_9CYAN|nr:hypothetical protein [Planktothrix tepida]CAD5988624.1 hypothetical protein PCC9214_05426 [Planktothrix tepida]CUR36206.1 conserved hypothetical protein [Planktothrix tepida PCC 9214]
MGKHNKKPNQQSHNKAVNNLSSQKTESPSQNQTITRLDPRDFSKKAYEALKSMAFEPKDDDYIDRKYHPRASGLVQGISAYISTWGLHRLSGDAKKFLGGTSEDTKYKGKVYRKFLKSLKDLTSINFDVDNEGSLIHLHLRQYTALNRLAIQLAKEWSFWAASVLGEAKEE